MTGPAHFGEVLQGMSAGRRVLLSLPCPLFHSRASFASGGHRAGEKARRAMALALMELDAPWRGGALTVHSNVPVGRGLGSSTADCVAAIRATALAVGAVITRETIARLVVAAEGAADSVMFPAAILFSNREGVVLEDFGGEVPPLEVLGFDTGGEGVDTLAHPTPAYTRAEQTSFAALIGVLRDAVARQDSRLAAHVATASARINQRYLPKPRFGDFEQVAEEVGALGILAAHSGTVAGLLFDPGDAATPCRVRRAAGQLARMGIRKTWHYVTRRG